jgi:Fe-S cluster biogenesis protein NfuA
MFIQTEPTPNPNSMKFIPDGLEVAGDRITEYKNKDQAVGKSKLAEELFEIHGVDSILFGSDFITVNKASNKDWLEIKTEILTTIMDFFISKKPVFNESVENKSESNEEDSEVVKQIKELLEVKIRPAVAMDGGDIIYRGFENGIVLLELKGSCSGCPSSTVTLKNGIENMLKHYVPEVIAVEQVSEE